MRLDKRHIIKEDDYQTSYKSMLPVLPYIKKEWRIWECASGDGFMIDHLKKHEFNIYGTDIKGGFDFLGHGYTIDFDFIITNPPYSLKAEFIKRAYEIGKPWAFLMPLTTLETESRQSLFRKYGVEIILPNKRMNFMRKNGIKGHCFFATAWFTYGLNIGRDLTFYNYNENQEKLF